ncbi:hypothetical protein Rmet_6404 [Cupriavidus metallidurans CH34]|uniref:Uncharacterized protein n=1 Tax=Cupriavidus metallidurans (strain ATCC 43123 / DSM 2839 / NBRC 102507 / CH34) TaxID=266264 RepID=D3DXK2_CUPMC|nr:hypothetical protein Rmet_6404 [Cupriavidus metallidurans CH34]
MVTAQPRVQYAPDFHAVPDSASPFCMAPTAIMRRQCCTAATADARNWSVPGPGAVLVDRENRPDCADGVTIGHPCPSEVERALRGICNA